MMEMVIGETPVIEQSVVKEALRGMLKEVGEESGFDFQTLATSVVEFRNERLTDLLGQLVSFL
jgi:hypothetical protein